MRKFIYSSLLIVIISVCNKAHAQDMDETLRRLVENTLVSELYIQGEKIICQQSLYTFYENRQFNLAWKNDKHISGFIDWVADVKWHGLDPIDYHYYVLNDIWNNRKNILSSTRMQASFDLVLTDAFLLLTGHLLSGKVDPYDTDTNWFAVKNEGDPVTILEQALKENNISQSLSGILPRDKSYTKLVSYLKQYSEIQKNGGWPPLNIDPIEKGAQNEDVLLLKKRLQVTGDLDPNNNKLTDIYDEALTNAVIKFQKRHGLAADGVAGKKTIEALNISVEQKIDQIEINLERFRWLNRDLGEFYVLVNIANYELEIFEKGKQINQRRVIVGKTYRKTPVFSSTLKYVVFNPDWTIPPTILKNDILPSVKKDPAYLTAKNIRVVKSDGAVIDPATIDWSLYPKNPFPYQLKQVPGPDNALGRVKFIFPNKFNVYLHDTPQRNLFEQSERAFSSGCIRVEDPLGLAMIVLNGQNNWTEERMTRIIHSKKTETVFLSKKVDVHLQYFTSWVNEDSTLHFRKDIYERDKTILAALNRHLHEN